MLWGSVAATGVRRSQRVGERVVQPLVVIPTYDERDTIGSVLEALLNRDDSCRILVVDDGSPDGTGRLVAEVAAFEPRVSLIERTAKGGLGSAYRAGYAHALSADADVLCQMDADLSHDPRQLDGLLAVVRDGADVAIGSRYVVGGDVRGWSWHRVLLSRVANRFVRTITGSLVHDTTAGFRAYRASALRALEVDTTRSDGYAFQIEMTLRAFSRGLEVREVPITFVERAHGRSKLSHAVSREAFVSVLRWGWRLRRGQTL
jgi:glycosyltransferase involved in cell wall biosynthesis